MLVLTRRQGERVFVGKDVTVTVLEIGRNKVRLGFDAPPEVTIHREEIYNAIQEGKSGHEGKP